MIQQNILNKIEAACRSDIKFWQNRASCIHEILSEGVTEECNAALNAELSLILKALAGWRSTIAAIGALETLEGGATKHFLEQEIVASWQS